MPQKLTLKYEIKLSDYLKPAFEKYDFISDPHGFLINGGCGIGKTFAILNSEMENGAFSIKHALEARLGRKVRMAFLCSREAAKAQNLEKYVSTVEQFIPITDEAKNLRPIIHENNIVCMTYHKFMSEIDHKYANEKTYDVIVCDECHSLFMDVFAQQMGAFLNWTLSYNGIIIWMTATDKPFRTCYNNFLKINNRPAQKFQCLFDEDIFLSRYDINQLIYSKSSQLDLLIPPIVHIVDKTCRALIFLQSANECYDYCSRANEYFAKHGDETPHAAFYLSQSSISETKEGESLLELYRQQEKDRLANKQENLRETLIKQEKYPDDIYILFTTDALRESINICSESNVKIVFTDDDSFIGATQKRGRVRDNLDKFYIITRRRGVEHGLDSRIKRFEELNNNSQQDLCQKFGIQENVQNNVAYVIQKGLSRTNEASYEINFAAKIALEERLKEYKEFEKEGNELAEAVVERFQHLSSNPIVIWEKDETREKFEKEMTEAVINKYCGVPLIDEVQEKLLNEAKEIYLSSTKTKDFTIKTVYARIRKYGYDIKRITIRKKHGLDEKYYGKKVNVIFKVDS